MAQLLQTVEAQSSKPFAILRLTCPAQNLSGRVALSKGRFIIGAQLTQTQVDGYAALSKLLSIKEGSYVFLETDSKEDAALGKPLHIRVSTLIECWPEIPQQSTDLFDEESLLDELFATQESIPLDINKSFACPPQTPLHGADQTDIKPDWQLFSSFMQEDNPPVTVVQPILPAGNRRLGKTTLDRMKAVKLTNSPLAGRALILVFILLAAFIAFLICLSYHMHNLP